MSATRPFSAATSAIDRSAAPDTAVFAIAIKVSAAAISSSVDMVERASAAVFAAMMAFVTAVRCPSAASLIV